MLGLRRQRAVGGTPHTRLELVATAGWLQGSRPAPRSPVPSTGSTRTATSSTCPVPDGVLTLARPPGTVSGEPRTWPDPAPSYAPLARLVDLMTEMTDPSSPLWGVFSILAVSASLAMMVRWWYLNRRK